MNSEESEPIWLYIPRITSYTHIHTFYIYIKKINRPKNRQTLLPKQSKLFLFKDSNKENHLYKDIPSTTKLKEKVDNRD